MENELSTIWNFYNIILKYECHGQEKSRISSTYEIQLIRAIKENNIQDALDILFKIIEFIKGDMK
jgi:hypothetical protein